mmetsp:Transcript_7599/g.19223  ORF Transcript_7599/g.19223 Transcript_7599/m.19223 type:complete len:416 (-) Transcript_7599:120-1367(-)
MDDRTAEFQALARSLPGPELHRRTAAGGYTGSSSSSGILVGQATSQHHGASPMSGDKGNAAKNNPAYAELRSFQLTAGGISKDIAATSALLTELTTMVRNQSILTDDSETQRMNQLVVRIKSSIENLNARLDHAGNLISQQKRRLGKNSQVGQQASNLVDELKSEFAHAASGFKQVLQQRTDTMKETDTLQKQVYGRNGPGGDGDDEDDNPIPNMSMAPPPVYGNDMPQGGLGGGGSAGAATFPTLDLTSGMMSPGESTGSLPRPHGLSSYGGGGGAGVTTPYHSAYNSFNGDDYGDRMPMTPLDIQRMEEESGMQMQLIPDQEYLQNRAEAMSEVEANIVELGTIFNKLAGMVAEHRDMVQRVEDNVDEANTTIGLSMEVLTDTLTSLRTNKKLALRLFGVLTVFIVMFIVFFA